ncbi:hypothetical protein HETIRDRAFT_156059 [Heterobasidion irregulare TC 32-1]|uniref:Pre-rRNA-processing protein IPI3 n=1 Tax=Heterobasidion irregulare (strain TC 32-1) TaxID=747525 RepID=W4JZX1_HETIT|nr:uncharacterized protein HETIRDRAFT_156059 [Heterobasidion irregulare TC 32-1]ETW79118.1 hypothetical protein HETIRDRAFT_156059 [Heterobasidion irregulare TC 32-1]
MQLQEVIICGSASSTSTAGSGAVTFHDIQTGSSLASFKQTSSASHCTAVVNTRDGQGGFILAAQPDKTILNMYSFQKDQIALKIVLPERLSCISVDNQGTFCAGGTAQGRIYLWEIASGILFNSWEAHYRQISVLRFSHDGTALFSGSEDSGVSVWSVSRLVDDDLQSELPTSYTQLSDHTLPITDIVCGVGSFPSCRLLTASVDHSVKLWDLSSKTLLTTFHFPHAIACIAWDVTERLFFAASTDGSIHQVNLFSVREDKTGGRITEAVGGAGVSDIIRIGDQDPREAKKRLISIGEPVTTLKISLTTSLLLVGTSTGLINIYDIPSRQLLRSITTHGGFGITYLDTMIKPPDLVGHVSLSLSVGGEKGGEMPVRPVMPFQRMREAKAREAHEVTMLLPVQNKPTLESVTTYSSEELLRDYAVFVQPVSDDAPTVSLQSRVAELEDEVLRLRGQLDRAKEVNDVIWQTVVQKSSRPDDVSNSSKAV